MKSECYCVLVGMIESHHGVLVKANGLSETVFDSWMEALRGGVSSGGYSKERVAMSALTLAAWSDCVPALKEIGPALHDVARHGVTWN